MSNHTTLPKNHPNDPRFRVGAQVNLHWNAAFPSEILARRTLGGNYRSQRIAGTVVAFEQRTMGRQKRWFFTVDVQIGETTRRIDAASHQVKASDAPENPSRHSTQNTPA